MERKEKTSSFAIADRFLLVRHTLFSEVTMRSSTKALSVASVAPAVHVGRSLLELAASR